MKISVSAEPKLLDEGALLLINTSGGRGCGLRTFTVAPHGEELSEHVKERIVSLHKDGLGYKRIASTLKLSCSTVAKTIQRFNRTGSTHNRRRRGRPKKLSERAQLRVTRGEAGGGVAAHLECPVCGHFSTSHAHQLTHMASSHPACLDAVTVGRLGNIVTYQSTARLFHCSDCFHTCRDFTKLYTKNEVAVATAGVGYHCLICGWRTKLKSLVVIHVARKHDIPKKLAAQAVGAGATAPRNATTATATAAATATAEDEDVVVDGLSGEMLKEEMEATAKVVRFTHNRFMCLICGWKTKLKGFAISHVVRCHDVERPYRCHDCQRSFFLPSRLQQHVRTDHRPGRYSCPFCCFRSHFLGGFRRHCSRCNAREGGRGGGGGGGGGGGEEEEKKKKKEEEERKGSRRRRRRTARVVMEEEEEED
ncbi:hypothetical protein PFLUV_G00000060 [Perca fluviatilis]|uniref:C2H2-type domain-containing protein n=1 Tax=Perca fluviatilis TaxID=8168 RepID=A0A6A5EX36_PERFL|nr:hypothetical protein PFLUV_G00000060 [Perca fluviatilis]